LRALFKDNEKEFPLKPLDKGDALRLELRTKDYSNTFAEATKGKERLTSTFGSLGTKPSWD
jgi:peroxiredoxin